MAQRWRWSAYRSSCGVPILIATVSITVMTFWHRGRELLNRKLAQRRLSHNHENGPELLRVPGRFLSGRIMPP
jgi:hypothetical protein